MPEQTAIVVGPYFWKFGLKSLNPDVSAYPYLGYDPRSNFLGVNFGSVGVNGVFRFWKSSIVTNGVAIEHVATERFLYANRRHVQLGNFANSDPTREETFKYRRHRTTDDGDIIHIRSIPTFDVVSVVGKGLWMDHNVPVDSDYFEMTTSDLPFRHVPGLAEQASGGEDVDIESHTLNQDPKIAES